MQDQIKAVLFDHDDTLVGTIRAKWAQHKYIARTFYGRELSDEKLRAHWGKPLTALIRLLYEIDDVDGAMARNVAMRKDFPKELFEDTLTILHFLQQMGKVVGIVTATTRSSLDHDMELLKIPKDWFHYIQTEEDTAFHKPDVRVFEPAMRWLAGRGILPKETVYVGDSFNDMDAALGAGLHFIGTGTGLVSADEFSKRNVKEIKRLSELRTFFEFL